ncbi:MAG TPA: hypothetical protein VLF40_04165 [Candidatus Saccharimonadales bacterium]|nr:hypothetical protein [Candidatus Saccharimonadales bacterium]
MSKAALIRVGVSFLVLAGSMSSIAQAASADTAPSKILTITPTTTKPIVAPGSSVSGKFQIINQGTSDYPVRIYAAPYTVHSEDYKPDFTPVPGTQNAADWLHLAISGADIAANHTLDVNYTVTVPSGTAPGGYYAVAFAETKTATTRQGVVVNERVGEIFYIQVAGKVRQAGKLLTWSTPFLQTQPLQSSLRLENDGGLDYASDIRVSVRDLFGRPKYTLNTTKEVLPQTIRHIPITWDKSPVLGLFKVTGTVTVAGKTQPLATHYVLVASPPLRLAGLALAAVLIAYFAGRKLFRYRRARNRKPAD